MIIHMKTTLIIPDHIMRQLRRRAARSGQTLSAVVAEALKRGLSGSRPKGVQAPLPVHRMGRPRIDVADRDSLYRAMDST
jgi:plasmid stability protein